MAASTSTRTFSRAFSKQCAHLRTTRRAFTSTPPPSSQPEAKNSPIDPETLLSQPTWSISSLLPPTTERSEAAPSSPSEPPVSSKQLHHLLRLSALPPPSTPEAETRMLDTLASQLHLVRSIQSVDTTGVEPLRSLRDESEAGENEAEMGLEELKGALGREEGRGKWFKRVRRRSDGGGGKGVGAEGEGEGRWDALGQAGRTTGRYFVVEGGKKKEGLEG